MESEAFLSFNELSTVISQMITLMTQFNEPIPKEVLSNINKLNEVITDLIDNIQNEFLSDSNQQNIIQFKKPDNKIYQLKISLKYTKPPIWRTNV